MLGAEKGTEFSASCVGRQPDLGPLRKTGPVHLQETAEKLDRLHDSI